MCQMWFVPPGHEDVRRLSVGRVTPRSRDKYLTGAVNQQQRARHTDGVVRKPDCPQHSALLHLPPQMILRCGTSLWMGSRSWTPPQSGRRPEGWGPARLGIIRCRRAVRPHRDPQADLQARPRCTAEHRTGLRAGLNTTTSIRGEQVKFHVLSYSTHLLLSLLLTFIPQIHRWNLQSVQTGAAHEETQTRHLSLSF